MKFGRFRTIDWSLYIIPLILMTTGIATIYTVSYSNKGSELAVTQAIYAVIGMVLMLVLTFIDYRIIKALALPLYILGLLMLAALVIQPIAGTSLVVTSFGASRWIDLGFTQIQPSEFFKLVLTLTLAGYLSQHKGNVSWKHVLVALGITMVPIILTLKQPDLGTASVLFVILAAILITIGLPRRYLYILGGVFVIFATTGWFFLKDYQRERIITFLDPQKDPLGAGYNVLQSMIAVGSGGLTGRGFGQGSQSQLNFLPVAHTDFIFAGLAEATGFIGCVVLIILFLLLFIRVINTARVAKDNFGMLVAIGIGAMLLFQFFVNIGMNIAIMPVTGIPLPFLSSGGTALIMTLMGMGILQSIYLRHKKITF